jgi:hypothetical protein
MVINKTIITAIPTKIIASKALGDWLDVEFCPLDDGGSCGRGEDELVDGSAGSIALAGRALPTCIDVGKLFDSGPACEFGEESTGITSTRAPTKKGPLIAPLRKSPVFIVLFIAIESAVPHQLLKAFMVVMVLIGR